MNMRTNLKIEKKVELTLSSIDKIEEVKISPFFKEKVMHQIRNASEAKNEAIVSWFTPSLQFATLVLFIVLNIYAYKSLTSEDYNSKVEEFVDTYDFGEETYTSIFN